MKRTQKGFTLIELLVVIAIIGILSAISLASLSTARNKADDAKVEGQLSSMRAAAEIYYGNNGNSYGVSIDCTSGLFQDATGGMKGLVAATAGTHCGWIDAWSASAPLVSTTSAWCVDSTGASKSEATQPANDVTVCP